MSKTKNAAQATPDAPMTVTQPDWLKAVARVIAEAAALDHQIDKLASNIDNTRQQADALVARIKGCAGVRDRAKLTIDDAILTGNITAENQGRDAISHANETEQKCRADLHDLLPTLDKLAREQDSLRLAAIAIVGPVGEALRAVRLAEIAAQHRLRRAEGLINSLHGIRRDIEADQPAPSSPPAAAVGMPVCPRCNTRDRVLRRGGTAYACDNHDRRFHFDVFPKATGADIAAEPSQRPACPRCRRSENVSLLPTGEFQCVTPYHGALTF